MRFDVPSGVSSGRADRVRFRLFFSIRNDRYREFNQVLVGS